MNRAAKTANLSTGAFCETTGSDKDGRSPKKKPEHPKKIFSAVGKENSVRPKEKKTTEGAHQSALHMEISPDIVCQAVIEPAGAPEAFLVQETVPESQSLLLESQAPVLETQQSVNGVMMMATVNGTTSTTTSLDDIDLTLFNTPVPSQEEPTTTTTNNAKSPSMFMTHLATPASLTVSFPVVSSICFDFTL